MELLVFGWLWKWWYLEAMLINTIKNTFNTEKYVENVVKKVKKNRIVWYDQVAKNSITAGQRLFANARINSSLKKSSNLKT